MFRYSRAFTVLALLAIAGAASAHNCGSLTDCYMTGKNAAVMAALGVAALIGIIYFGPALAGALGGRLFLGALMEEAAAAAAAKAAAEAAAKLAAAGLGAAIGDEISRDLPTITIHNTNQADGETNSATGESPSESKSKPDITSNPHIEDYKDERGWTDDSIKDVINDPSATFPTKDERYNEKTGTRNDDPATGYFDKDGNYVIVNDNTGDIVQLSDKNDPNWEWEPKR